MKSRNEYPNQFNPEFRRLMKEAAEHDPLASTEVYEASIVADVKTVTKLISTVGAIEFAHVTTVQNYQAYAHLTYVKKSCSAKIIDPTHILNLTMTETMINKELYPVTPYFPAVERHIDFTLRSLRGYQPVDGSKPKPFSFKMPKGMQGVIMLSNKDIRFQMNTDNKGNIDEIIRIAGLPYLHCAVPVIFPRSGNMSSARLIVRRDKYTGDLSIRFQCKGSLSLKYIATHGFPTDPGYISPV